MNKKLIVLIALLLGLTQSHAFAYMTPKGINISGTAIVMEGATDDDYETSLSVTDPTADRTILIPNASGTIQLSAAQDAASAVTLASNSIVFEGATADAFEETVSPADPSADGTITIPNVTGIMLTDASASITSAQLTTAITNETGTGVAVFATTPTLVTPVIGAATGTSLALTGNMTSSSTSDIGWSLVSGANTACNTTCTNGCVMGQDTATFAIVACTNAIADVCICAGSN